MNDMENAAILKEALAVVNGDRQKEYGSPVPCYERVAALWSAWLGKAVTAHDVACMMALMKLGREAGAHKHDNLLDAAGYIGIAADCAQAGREAEA